MSEHQAHGGQAHEGHPASTAGELKFEKSELEYFVDDDRDTGKKIGKMLALIFCVLLVLMVGVAWWTNFNEFASQDPFDVPVLTTAEHGSH